MATRSRRPPLLRWSQTFLFPLWNFVQRKTDIRNLCVRPHRNRTRSTSDNYISDISETSLSPDRNIRDRSDATCRADRMSEDVRSEWFHRAWCCVRPPCAFLKFKLIFSFQSLRKDLGCNEVLLKFFLYCFHCTTFKSIKQCVIFMSSKNYFNL